MQPFEENTNQTEQRTFALCIIVETKGSTPRKTGAKMKVYEDGRIEGTIGGGNFEKKVIEDAVEQMKSGEPRLFEHHLLQEHEMCCGGSVKVYIEPVVPKKQLIIFGAGHVGKALSELAVKADFEVTVVDDRPEYILSVNHPEVKTIEGDFLESLKNISFSQHTFSVILTYNHDTDRKILKYCLENPFGYIGFIGSQRKIIITKKLMQSFGISEDKINAADMPVGLHIHAETPFEIAVSILAKLISVRNNPGKDFRKNTREENPFKKDEKSNEPFNDIDQCLQKLL
jgi:xanthine dehydrogenase accessory factor